MPVSDQLIDQLLANYKSPEDLFGEQGILKQLTKKLAERALEAEMEQHLGYAKHDATGKNTGNSRNGESRKSVRTIYGDIELETPRDRNGSFEPQLVKKHQTQLTDEMERKIIGLFSLGSSYQDIRAHIEDMYGMSVSNGTVNAITDKLLPELQAWREREQEPLYPVIWRC